MEALHAYMPVDRCWAALQGVTIPDHALGAALFVDIKGFTPLTHALAQELGAQRGAEELTHLLNQVYGVLVEKVHAYRGSVIGFCGDAIISWFDADDGRLAITSALAMQTAIRQFAQVKTPGGAVHTIAIKVGLTTGPVRRLLVGKPEVQVIDVLAGQTLEHMSAAEKHGTTGEVVVTGELARRFGSQIEVHEWRVDEKTGEQFAVVSGLQYAAQPDPWPSVPQDAIPFEETSAWLMPAIVERLTAGQGEFLAELRPAVALFGKFAGIDYDQDEHAGQLLDRYVRWVQEVVTYYDGILVQLTIGDKGSYFYAAFGAPAAHDDDAVRAVAAGLVLKSPPPELSYIHSLQTGICKGQMRTGAYGSPERRTYGVLGDKVNLAARLMSAAQPGEILCDYETAQAAGTLLEFEALPVISVKGRLEPVAVYRPVGERKKISRPAFKTSIVGRLAERCQLWQALAGLQQGQSGVVIIEGEAGMGKTVLVDELRQRASELGIESLSGTGEAVDTASPYHGWRGVFIQLFKINQVDDPELQQQALLKSLAGRDDLVSQAPLLNAVLPFALPETGETQGLSGQVRANSTRQLLTHIIEDAAVEGPRMIIIEDAHWLDSLSWEFAVHVALTLILSGAPLLLVIAARPMEETSTGGKHLHTLRSLEAAHTLSLGPLSPAETAAVAEASLGLPPGSLPEEAASLVRQRAEGNPFFAEELILTLREQGFIQVVYGGDSHDGGQPTPTGCVLVGDLKQAAQALPGNIQGLILARIDRLPPERQLTLKVAAVLGRTFAYTPLVHMLKLHTAISEVLLKLHLEAMAALDLTPVFSVEPDLTYIFKHIITHEVAYETLLYAQRRQLHATVAAWYESSFPAQLDELAPALAYHFGRAGNHFKALEYLLRSGERARSLYALQEAIDHFQSALKLLASGPPDGEAAPGAPRSAGEYVETVLPGAVRQIDLRLGELLTTTGRYDEALPHLDAALAQATMPEEAASACRWRARLHELRGEYPEALEWIQRGLEAQAGAESAETTELLLLAGLIHTRQGHIEEALSHSQRAMQIAADLHKPAALARANILVGHTSRLRGQSAQAIESFQQALSLYHKAGDLHGKATSHNQIANAYFNMGRWTYADHHYREARQVFGDIGDIYNRAFAENNLGGIALNQGRLDEARHFYETALRELKQTGGSPYVLGVIEMNLGATFVRCRDLGAARHHLCTSQEYFQQAQARDFLPELHRHFAEAALLGGETAEAGAQANRALELARQLEMRGEEGCALRVLGEAQAGAGQPENAQDLLRQSIDILDSMDEEYEAARSRLSLAHLLAAAGEGAASQALLAECKPVFERLQAAIELEGCQSEGSE